MKLRNIEVKRGIWLLLLSLSSLTGTEMKASTAEGTTAQAIFSTTEVDFGRVPIGDTYTRSVTVTNAGNANLVIGYLSFSDVNVFSTTTKLPLTVIPGDSKELNITYTPSNSGNIERTLTVFSNSVSDQDKIKLKAQPYAVNELHIQPVSGFCGEEVTISMVMNNMDPVSGYQVEFEMPDQLEYMAGSFTLSNRKQDHSSAVSVNDRVLRIIVYSQSDKPFTGNEGEIGAFRVKLVGRDNIELKPSKTVLSATVNHVIENVVSDVYGALITINTLDNPVEIKDVVQCIMSGSYFKKADLNNDGKVNAADIVELVNLLITKSR